jgi:Amt family ammonium transporter
VHGVGGTLGAILTGVFAAAAINMPPVFKVEGQPDKFGLIEGSTTLFTNQLIATAITWVFALIGAFVLLKLVDVVMGLRVTESDETDGLDLSQHGESGYNLEDDVFGGAIATDGSSAGATAGAGAAIPASSKSVVAPA